ncbi:hypothetical protein B0T24DRAFT_618521 [Lasiosphaeria ovina]|uniref:Uncharacterized protein n=1 Tax=Lasiosphaeria ovina TaxID=92902 RepID=A0AAE0KHL0_9PEZI|nr:hypothetical protein B0T24DRAFT_618521 [Lasiosphaeria ovina]
MADSERHHRRHSRRRETRSNFTAPPGTGSHQRPRVLSHIYPLYLEENVGGGRGTYANVSVLEPVMRIERSGPQSCHGDPHAKPVYRIVVNFQLQFSINQVGEELQRHNRIFDSVNVRYLYRSGERHDLVPKGDQVASDIQIRNENGQTSDVQAGVTATVAGQPMPAFTVHAQHASKLTYERKLRSWRKSLTYETYPQPRIEVKETGLASLLGIGSPVPPSPETQFRVSSIHAHKCACRKPRRCRVRNSSQHVYNRAAHWSGQTEAQLHLWTPEIYESMNCPITVTREVDAELIDHILSQDPSYGHYELRRYLHFDFDVEVRLREIGRGFWGMFKSASQPPEIRARNDPGRPLPPDQSKFCVTCCVERINWPQHETRDLQCEAEEQMARFGIVKRLQSTEEYQNTANQGATSFTTAPGQAPTYIQGAAAAAATMEAATGPSLQTETPRGRTRAMTRTPSDGQSNIQACRRVSFSPDHHLRTFGRRRQPAAAGRRARSRTPSPAPTHSVTSGYFPHRDDATTAPPPSFYHPSATSVASHHEPSRSQARGWTAATARSRGQSMANTTQYHFPQHLPHDNRTTTTTEVTRSDAVMSPPEMQHPPRPRPVGGAPFYYDDSPQQHYYHKRGQRAAAPSVSRSRESGYVSGGFDDDGDEEKGRDDGCDRGVRSGGSVSLSRAASSLPP